ncbi:MAG: Parallel beta-helix repeat [Anaerocolumna sp.]|jgi:hypothetical protein|nr:Parallel beta-helix repeat [Anaerocolumna sp.]
MKGLKRNRVIFSILICFVIVISLGGIWTARCKIIKEISDSVYIKEDAYVFNNAYTYGVSASEAGEYSVAIKGGNLKDKTIKVNGLVQPQAKGMKAVLLLNKGINSITFENGEDISELTIKNGSKREKFGALVTYTSYEAEQGETNGEISENSRIYREFASEASERGYVALNNTGEYVSIKLKNDTNALVIRYCIPDSVDGKGLTDSINLYMDKDKKTIEVTSKYSWVYGDFPWNNDPKTAEKGGSHMFFDDVRIKLDKSYPAGTELKIMKDAENTAKYYLIDCIETEEIEKPLEEPVNALNVLNFGAIPDDGEDDAKAISDCIQAAVKSNKEVYIPAGRFEIGNPVFIRGIVLKDNNVTIRGAGMWHTVLHGNAAAFAIRAGNISFYDFSILGEVISRKDSIDPPAFSMVTPVKGMENVTIQNIWMEHFKVGVWADVTNGMNILGCRIRNTFADGINLCAGTSNSVITQNDIRNTGDDAIAMFNRGVLEVNNKVLYNTVSLPWLANNIALYGGKDIVIKGNWLKDTICFGGGINISTNFKPQVFEGTILVEGNKLERCGSRENNINAEYGAIWINTVEGYDNQANCIIINNVILDSTYQGISFFNSGLLENMIIEKNLLSGTGTYAIEVGKEVKGFAIIRNNQIRVEKAKEVNTNQNMNFEIRKK